MKEQETLIQGYHQVSLSLSPSLLIFWHILEWGMLKHGSYDMHSLYIGFIFLSLSLDVFFWWGLTNVSEWYNTKLSSLLFFRSFYSIMRHVIKHSSFKMTLLPEFRITIMITSHIFCNYRRTHGLSRNQFQLLFFFIWNYIQCNTCTEYICILVISIHMLQIGSEQNMSETSFWWFLL